MNPAVGSGVVAGLGVGIRLREEEVVATLAWKIQMTGLSLEYYYIILVMHALT